MSESAISWSWGCGWDSTAGIILDVLAGKPIALTTFADHGGEKRYPDREAGEEVGTYEFLDIFSDWMAAKGYDRPVVCRYTPKQETSERYEQSVLDIVRELQLEHQIDLKNCKQLGGIYGNAVANETLPGLAFSLKSCSVKWKLEAQEPI